MTSLTSGLRQHRLSVLLILLTYRFLTTIPAVLYGAQPTTSGLVLFSENAQFMLSTENDVLEPRTARTTLLSTYNYNGDSNPIVLGTTIGFVSGIGRYTRFYEMANVSEMKNLKL